MSQTWVPVWAAANHKPCDLCDKTPVGWTQIDLPDRSLGGVRAREVFMVCADHIYLGSPVYPK